MEPLPRCLPAFLPVCATTNPNLSWMTGADTDGLRLLAAWVVVHVSSKAPEHFGMAAAIVAAPVRRWSMSAGSGLASVPPGNGRPSSGSRRDQGSGFPGAISAAG